MPRILYFSLFLWTFGLGACSTQGRGAGQAPGEVTCPDGQELDCAGVCGGPGILDCDGVCDGGAVADCAGVCHGEATLDCFGVCEGTAIEDCDGICGGETVEDCAGVCGGELVEDCAGVCGGGATVDCAGMCEGEAAIDCAGICDGDAIADCAGECNGTASLDCTGKCQGLMVEDCAGVCGGTALEDCAGVCEGTWVVDACGECNAEPGFSCCPDPVVDLTGMNDYTGASGSFMNLDTDVRFDSEFSFTGWVRFNNWTGSFNRVFDFGRSESMSFQSMRMHRNMGGTFRMAFNDWDMLDVPNYWVLDEFTFVTATVDADGIWSIYKDGEMVSNEYVARCEEITWALVPNYFVAKSNWVGTEPNSNVSVRNLQWFDEVVSPECIEALYQDAP
jgi:hypothetical protein